VLTYTILLYHSYESTRLTILKQSGKSIDEIGDTLGHSTSQATEHYTANLDMDKMSEIN